MFCFILCSDTSATAIYKHELLIYIIQNLFLSYTVISILITCFLIDGVLIGDKNEALLIVNCIIVID